MVESRYADDDLSKLLFHLAEPISVKEKALVRGELVCLGHPIIRGSMCSHLYVSMPVLMPDEFNTYAGSDPPTVFAWLFPIGDSEADFVRERGWIAFEDEVEKQDPNLLDPHRPMILPRPS